MFVISKRGFKAQFTMKALLEVLLVLVVYSQLYPAFIGNPDSPMNELITDMETTDPITASLLSLLPFVLVAMIIIGIIGYNVLIGRRR